MIWATEYKHVDLVKLLLSKGSDINIRDNVSLPGGGPGGGVDAGWLQPLWSWRPRSSACPDLFPSSHQRAVTQRGLLCRPGVGCEPSGTGPETRPGWSRVSRGVETLTPVCVVGMAGQGMPPLGRGAEAPGSPETALGCVLVGQFACGQHRALVMKLKGSLISGRLRGSREQWVGRLAEPGGCPGMDLCAASQARDRVPGTRTGCTRGAVSTFAVTRAVSRKLATSSWL